MRRPPSTLEALRFSPLMQARRAHPASVERIPLIATGARPAILPAGRPAAEGAADAWAARLMPLLFIQFVINNNGGLVILKGEHASILWRSSVRPLG
jgi:hypothetical protein